ncbi:hypothetical protein RJ640_001937 [Escallonia rubra]|uniref:Protein kinase domain-containing protein n=1 Tax=Escallonia rubra TaxID=112253 RepID=A0AA88QLJ1_9ASTE|nr:hypothetical protein RJ640_001937 [Escallonia rubra]
MIGPLRCWPGGLCLSRFIGDVDVGEFIVPIPYVKQVKLSNVGGRLIIASDGIWDALSSEKAAKSCLGLPAELAARQLVKPLPPPKKQNKFRALLFRKKSRDSASKLSKKLSAVGIVEQLFEEGSAMLAESSGDDRRCGLCKLDCNEPGLPKIQLVPEGQEFEVVSSLRPGEVLISNELIRRQLSVQSCEAISNLTLPSSPSLSFIIPHNLTVFKCDKRLNDLEGYRFQDCNYHTYYYRHPLDLGSIPSDRDPPPPCRLMQLPSFPLNELPSDASNLFQLLASTFTVELHLSDKCLKCRKRGGLCLDEDQETVCKYGKGKKHIRLILGTEGRILGTDNDDIPLFLQEDTSMYSFLPELLKYRTDYGGGGCDLAMVANDTNPSDALGVCDASMVAPMDLVEGDVGAFSVAGFAIFVIVVAGFIWRSALGKLMVWRKKENYHNVENFLSSYGTLVPKRYSYSDLKKITNSFLVKLGQGGYGCVYKGKLPNGSLVAVKVLNESKGGEEFINEVASISRTSHVNVVTLLGFCFEGHKKALIYEFMPHGSLEKFIYKESSLADHQLGWERLSQIAIGIARGLEYLHRGCNTRILHLDIKPHNILLDEDFCPKISDFGLAKLCSRKESIVSMLNARGTVGYIAPEVFCRNFGGVSHKSDVYSYGMMVLEMVGGRNKIKPEVDGSTEMYFSDWIYNQLELDELGAHNGITTEAENEMARKMVIVSLWCIQTAPSSRPSMTRVVEMLEGSIQSLQIPPKLVLYSPPRSREDSSTIESSGMAIL